MAFGRNEHDQTARPLRFIASLRGAVQVHLPEAAHAALGGPIKSSQWRTVRVRPELMVALAALQARYAKGNPRSPDLSISEAMAAALASAMPALTRGEFRQ
jgi:hypothetical protein